MPSSSPPPTDQAGHLLQIGCLFELLTQPNCKVATEKKQQKDQISPGADPSLTCLHDRSADEENWTKLANRVSSYKKGSDIFMKATKKTTLCIFKMCSFLKLMVGF